MPKPEKAALTESQRHYLAFVGSEAELARLRFRLEHLLADRMLFAGLDEPTISYMELDHILRDVSP